MENIVEQLADAYVSNTNKSLGYVFINNHFSGYAPPTARKFKELLTEKSLTVIEPSRTTFKE